MGSILIDLNNDSEVSELLAVVLYDESHYLRGYLRSINEELVRIIVEHYARGVSFENIVRGRESGLTVGGVRKRCVTLEREVLTEMRRLKAELRCVLRELQEER